MTLSITAQANASIKYEKFNIDTQYPKSNKLSKEETIDQIVIFAKYLYQELENCKGPTTKDFKNDVVYCPNIFEAERIRLAFLAFLASYIDTKLVETETKNNPDFVRIIDNSASGDTNTGAYPEFYTPKLDENNIFYTKYNILAARILHATANKEEDDILYERIGHLNNGIDPETIIWGQKIGQYQSDPAPKMPDNLSELCKDENEHILQYKWKRFFIESGNEAEADKKLTDFLDNIGCKYSEGNDNKALSIHALVNASGQDLINLSLFEAPNIDDNGTNGTTDPQSDFIKVDYKLGLFLTTMMSNPDNVRKILDHRRDIDIIKRWLPFNAYEMNFFFNSENAFANPADTANQYYKTSSACLFRGVTALFICAPTRFMTNTATGGMKIVGDALRLKTEIFVKTSKKTGSVILHDAWKFFRNFSNIILILVFIIMIFGTITNFRNGNYHFRRLLPRLAIFALLINLSYFLIAGAADMSNIVGDSLAALLAKLGSVDYGSFLITLGAEILAGSSLFLLFGSAVFTAAIFIPIIIVVFLTVLIAFVMLAVRDAVFVILVLIMPIALASLITASSNKLFSLWSKTMTSILMFYPMASALIGAAGFVAKIMYQSGGVVVILSPLPIIASYLALPKLLLTMINSIPLIGSKVGSLASSIPQSAREKYEKTNFHQQVQQAHLNRQRQMQRGSKTPLQKVRRQISNFGTGVVGNLHNLTPEAMLRNKGFKFNQGDYFDYKSTIPEIDEKAFTEVLNLGKDQTLLGENVAQSIIKNLITSDPDFVHDNSFSSDLSYVNSSSMTTAENDQTSTFLNSIKSNPNIILSSMVSMADNGHGDFDDIRRASQIYLNRGGDSELLKATFKTIDKMYEKEDKQAPASLVRQLYKRVEKTNGATLEQALNGETHTTAAPGNEMNFVKETSTINKTDLENNRINIISDSFADRTNWMKFKGYASGSLEDVAFKQFIAGFHSGPVRDQQIDRICKTVTSQKGLKYLDSFR
ncbi:MAG: hypothetical protein Q3996_00380 [Candidatus Saccharibacteria bacterium]|nr:hypothetical protein [Candidatus Saccharibacteria bacterium]